MPKNIDPTLDEMSPEQWREDAQQRGDQLQGELVSKKELLSLADFLARTGAAPKALAKAVQEGRVFTVEYNGVFYYPAFFTGTQLSQRQVRQVSKALGDLSGWEKWLFFTTPKASLAGETPLTALKAGNSPTVLKAAKGQAER